MYRVYPVHPFKCMHFIVIIYLSPAHLCIIYVYWLLNKSNEGKQLKDMIYVNQKPVILVCNNTAYVKMLENIKPYFENGETDFPYKGAKEHYILDIDNKETLDLFNNRKTAIITK